MTRKSRKPPENMVMHRTSTDVNVEEVDEESREVTLSFVSEQPVGRWFGQEVLQIDENSMDLTRFKNGLGCLLFNHNRNIVLGKIIKAWSENQKGYAKVKFDTGEEEDKIFEKVKSKTLQGTSVGYNVLVWEKVSAGTKSTSGRVKGPAYVAVKWEPLEISITPVPADDSVGVGRNFGDFEKLEGLNMENELEEQDQTRMQDENEQEPSTAKQQRQNQQSAEVSETEKENIREMERRRTIEIMNLCREFDMDSSKYITEGTSIDKVREEILIQMKEKNKPSSTARHLAFGDDETDKFVRAATDSIMMRAGMELEKCADGTEELRSLSLRDMMIECLERAGEMGVKYKETDDLIRMSRMGTGALPMILSGVVNKTLSETYKAVPTTFELWTSVGSVNDFKEAPTYTLSEAGSLVEIKESGEFKSDAFKESGTTRKVATFGRKWSLTRQMIINDDLSALTKLPQRYVSASKRGLNRLVYKTLIESKAFSAANKNLAVTGDLPSVKSIGEARAAMRMHKNLKGEETLNIRPKFILVPAVIETQTEQFIYSNTDPALANPNIRNPFQNKLEIISDAEIDDLSKGALSWYLAASPNEADTIQVDYLRGNKTPKIQSVESFDVLGWQWRIYFDYGVTLLDYKGLYKNPGKKA